MARIWKSWTSTTSRVNTTKPPLESAVVKKILAALRSRGGFWFKIHGTPLMLAGLPDIVGCYMGRFVAFEVKRGPGIPAKPIQDFTISRIRRAGGVALLIHSVQMALDELREIEEATTPPA
jgi:hypothetical protein